MQARREPTRPASAALAVVALALAGCQAAAGPSSPGSSTSGTSAPTSKDAGYSVVVLGDSLPYGGEDCGGCDAFGAVYGALLAEETGRAVEVANLSTHDGVNTPQLLERVQGNPQLRASIAGADVVVVSTGHNDTPWIVEGDDACDGAPGEQVDWSRYTEACAAEVAAAFGVVLDELLVEVAELRDGAPTAVRVITFYNDWIGYEDATPEATVPSTQVLDAFSSTICEVAAARDAVCADTYHAFNGPDGSQAAGTLLADDYTHPSGAGHVRIAEVLLATGTAPLS